MVKEGDGKKQKKPEYLQYAFWLKCVFSLIWIGFLIGMNHSNSGVLLKLFILTGSITMVIYWYRYPFPFDLGLIWGEDELKEEKTHERNEK